MAREFVHVFSTASREPIALRVALISAVMPTRNGCIIRCGDGRYETADAYKLIELIENPDSFGGAAKSPTPSGEPENRDSIAESAKSGLRDPGKSTT
jgi:hypothetical protein